MSLKKALSIFITTSACIIFSIGFYYGAEIARSIHKEIIGFLVTLSAIIFGVMGAWLSITKIELQQGVETANSNKLADSEKTVGQPLYKLNTINQLTIEYKTKSYFGSAPLSFSESMSDFSELIVKRNKDYFYVHW